MRWRIVCFWIKLILKAGTVRVGNQAYPLLDNMFQTVSTKTPYALTPDEQHVVNRLRIAFVNNEKLQQHARFLFDVGSMYKTHNGNLLYHGCLPMNEDGSFKSIVPGFC